jgi:hypothetical protein
MSLVGLTNLRKILHPTRKALKVAKEVKDALDGRIDFYGPFAVTHVLTPRKDRQTGLRLLLQ